MSKRRSRYDRGPAPKKSQRPSFQPTGPRGSTRPADFSPTWKAHVMKIMDDPSAGVNAPNNAANDRSDEARLDAALALAKIGWPVVPLHEVLGDGTCSCGDRSPDHKAGKHPRIKGWEKLATTDEAQIGRWWRRWPTANVGVACRPGGVFMIGP